MSFKPNELRAIAHYAELNGLIPQLSIKPTVRFTDKKTGATVERSINGLLREYEDRKKVQA